MLVVVAYRFYSGYIPVSSFKGEIQEKTETEILEICGKQYTTYPGFEWPFPFYSPNGEYYVNIVNSGFRNAEVLKLYRTDKKQPMGNYSYFKLTIYCWAKDSSGIYIADYDPGDSSLFIPFNRGGKTSPIKKLLVP